MGAAERRVTMHLQLSEFGILKLDQIESICKQEMTPSRLGVWQQQEAVQKSKVSSKSVRWDGEELHQEGPEATPKHTQKKNQVNAESIGQDLQNIINIQSSIRKQYQPGHVKTQALLQTLPDYPEIHRYNYGVSNLAI